jgi:hypothetical protein
MGGHRALEFAMRNDVFIDTRTTGDPADPRAPVFRPNRLISVDLNPAVLLIVAGAYIAMLGVFWLGFANSAESAQEMGFVTLVFVAFLGLPLLLARAGRAFLARQGKVVEARHRFSDFLSGEFESHTGPVPGREAVVQVATIPVALLLAAAGIAIAFTVV